MAINPADVPVSSGSDLLPQPFRLLGIDPGATAAEIEAALTRAQAMRVVPEKRLTDAHADILDPARRLPNELSYPIGNTPDRVELFFADLPASTSDQDILQMSAPLAPLSRANFIARHAGRRGASVELLVGLIDAHDAIDVMEIYEVLQALRHRACWPPPSLASVRDGVNDLLTTHCVTIIEAYDPIESAAEPLLQSTRQLLATREPSLIQAHSFLLAAYRHAVAALRAKADQQVGDACEAIKQQADDTSSIEKLADALLSWRSLCEPLLLLDAHEGFSDPAMNVTPDRIFGLLGDLSKQHRYLEALQVLHRAVDAFSSIPDAAARLAEVGEILREMLHINANNTDSAADLPAPAPAAATRRGFGHAKKAALAAVALLTMIGCLVAYRSFDNGAAVSVVAAPEPVQSKAEPELLPPTGRGQRLAREYVRYCRFQEERLRVIKQQVRGSEDIRAYNALANDYNSRCSDFFYQDEDHRIVKEEVIANQKLLEADAERILSTWPWRTNAGRDINQMSLPGFVGINGAGFPI
jgi:hypothetical protein